MQHYYKINSYIAVTLTIKIFCAFPRIILYKIFFIPRTYYLTMKKLDLEIC